jgi:hypothetical protein
MSVGPAFDLLLQDGRVIDPGSGTDGLRGVAIRNGKTAVVQSGVLRSSAREVVDVTGKIVLGAITVAKIKRSAALCMGSKCFRVTVVPCWRRNRLAYSVYRFAGLVFRDCNAGITSRARSASGVP